jgi:hypothetical protein
MAMQQMSDLTAKIAEMQQQAKQRAESKPLASEPLPKNVVQLPLWPEPTRGVPNGVLRSALFGAIKKGARRYMEGEQVAALDGIEIRYTGQRLDQGDLDVWESVLHVTRAQEMGELCRFTAYGLLKLMGRTDTGSNRETLHKRLIRLRANAVEVQQGRYSYAGGLIDEVYKDKETHEYVVVLNPKLRPLFASDQFSQIEWAVRHNLSGQQLAQWLHGFYASHAKAFPIKVDTLHALCGSEAKRLSDFKIDLRKALDAVVEACKANGEAFSYEIVGDLVYVDKTPSKAQQRHLTQKRGATK